LLETELRRIETTWKTVATSGLLYGNAPRSSRIATGLREARIFPFEVLMNTGMLTTTYPVVQISLASSIVAVVWFANFYFGEALEASALPSACAN
jgi:hypothetical protein